MYLKSEHCVLQRTHSVTDQSHLFILCCLFIKTFFLFDGILFFPIKHQCLKHSTRNFMMNVSLHDGNLTSLKL